MVSTTTMIKKLEGLLGTNDLTPWEQGFVESLVRKADSGQVTQLTDKQLESLERLHDKHFA